MSTIDKPNRRNRTNLLVDSVIFLAFLVVMAPRFSGVAIHEWLGMAFGAAIITHLLLHWQWIVEITKRFFSKAAWSARINYLLNILLFIDVAVIIYSGLAISRSVLPLLGIEIAANGLWRGIHTLSANGFLFLVGAHVALHWSWIINNIKRLLPNGQPRVARPVAAIAHQQKEI